MNNLLLVVAKPNRLLKIKFFSDLKLFKLFSLGVCFILILVAVYIFQINKFMLEKQQLELWQGRINELFDSNKELEFRLANLVHTKDESLKIQELGLEKVDRFNYLQPTEETVARKRP